MLVSSMTCVSTHNSLLASLSQTIPKKVRCNATSFLIRQVSAPLVDVFKRDPTFLNGKRVDMFDLSQVVVGGHAQLRHRIRRGFENKESALQLMTMGTIHLNPSPKHGGWLDRYSTITGIALCLSSRWRYTIIARTGKYTS